MSFVPPLRTTALFAIERIFDLFVELLEEEFFTVRTITLEDAIDKKGAVEICGNTELSGKNWRHDPLKDFFEVKITTASEGRFVEMSAEVFVKSLFGIADYS